MRKTQEERNIQTKLYYHKLRKDVLSHYSNNEFVCACCGEKEYKFLTLDHIDGGGNEHRRKVGHPTYSIYTQLRKANYPDGYQILCHNCNWGKGLYKICPHKNPSLLP